MTELPTDLVHRLQHWTVRQPTISAFDLAEYMVAPEGQREAIVRRSRFPAAMRAPSPAEARFEICRHLTGELSAEHLARKAAAMRTRLVARETDYVRNRLNADGIDGFQSRIGDGALPACRRQMQIETHPVYLEGVKVTADIPLRLDKTTAAGRMRLGGLVLRFGRGIMAGPETAQWLSSFVHGYLRQTSTAGNADIGHNLCLVADIGAARLFKAPTDAISRYKAMQAACADIAGQWRMLAPPRPAARQLDDLVRLTSEQSTRLTPA
ncbi:MAG: hypothetical protein R3D45_12720 [Rhizobiaceae bacterium]